jgi:group I intron endonuclease
MTYNDVCNIPNHAGIYCFKNKINGKCYIGQAIKLRNRLKAHWHAIQNHSVQNMVIYKAIDKYGIDNFELTIVYEIRNSLAWDTKKRLDELEKEYILKYNSYENGYNSTLGGDAGIFDYKMTDEQKEKIRQSSLKHQELTRQEKAKDSNNWIKCKNIQTEEEFVFKTRKEVSDILDIPEYTVKMCLLKKYHLGKKFWQICYYNEDFEIIPKYGTDEFSEWDKGHFKTLSNKEEICNFIKENPKCLYAQIKQQFDLSKKTFYNYKKELGITSDDTKVYKEDFVNYAKDHNKLECMEHFNIKERAYYRYKKKYIDDEKNF